MIIDSSVLVAVIRAEPDARDLLTVMRDADALRVSAATLLETSLVIGPSRYSDLDLIIAEGFTVIPFDAAQLAVARAAHARYGRGSGSPARLNFGDCFAYALATVTGEPLLFKGDDFRHTDVTAAIGE